MKKFFFERRIRKKVFLLLITAALAYGCSVYWYQLMLVQGSSMYPAYRDFQLVVLEKQFDSLQAGEVVAFWCEGLQTLLIKRIVAIPGDQVQIADGNLYVNNIRYGDQIDGKKISYAGIAKELLTLEEGEFFMLGDNYGASKDSRYEEVGCVKEKDIIGRVLPAK